MRPTRKPEARPPKTVAEASDPARYISSPFFESCEIRARPVYASWMRVDLSNHEALFQESGHHDTWSHVELSFVLGVIPMYQKFTGNVYGDCNEMALRGHDVGPMAAHISIPPTNMLMVMHLLSSSCKWPVTAKRRLHRGESLCAFASALAPYLFCNDEKEKQKEEGNKAESAPKSGANASSDVADSQAATQGGPLPAVIGNGIGLIMIPFGGSTVKMRLSILDIILGGLDIAIGKAIDVGFKLICKLVPDSLSPGVDAKRHISPFTKKAAQKAGNRDAARYMTEKMLNKATKAAVKGLLTGGQITAPFKLASYSFVTEETKMWTYSDAGWNEHSANVARVGLAQEPPGQVGGGEPAQEHSNAEKDYWTDPSSPTEPAKPDFWTDPSQLDEPEDPPGPYDPGSSMFDDFLEGAPHAW